MSKWIRAILESKREMRRRLAVLPFSEKVKLLEKLRDRSLAIASSPLRRSHQPGQRNTRNETAGWRNGHVRAGKRD